MLATSCNKETVEAKGDGGKVLVFKAATGKQTLGRAAEATLGTLQNPVLTPDGLDVYSYFAEGDRVNQPFGPRGGLFNITYNAGTGWTYGDPEYHPLDDLAHYSIYPSSAGAPDFTAHPTVTFPFVATDGQTDLMAAAYRTENTELGAEAVLLYSHLLSQINFAIVGIEGIQITISDIAVNGVKNEGTYTFGELPVWGATVTGSANYPYLLNGAGVTDAAHPDDTVYPLRTDENALMLMPQEFGPADAGNFSFTYTMRNEYGDLLTEEDVPVTVQFNDEALSTNTWLPSNRYLYTINFVAPYVLSFEISEPQPWIDDPAGNSEITVDAAGNIVRP
jgi:hypothetical protein